MLRCLPCCSCPAGYNAAIVFTVICMLLYNVQQDIEQPFDVSCAGFMHLLAVVARLAAF